MNAFSWESVILEDGEVTPVDSNLGQHVQRSKETPVQSRCPEAMDTDNLVEDSVLQILGAV